MYQKIWYYYFITGVLSLAASVPLVDSWVDTVLPPGARVGCRINDGFSFGRAHLAPCVASWVADVREQVGNGVSILADMHLGMPRSAWLQVLDVLLVGSGLIAALIAISWIWAGAMTRLAGLSLAGTYTLVRAVGLTLQQRRPT